jgi:primosomal protein N' (replication factor Y)
VLSKRGDVIVKPLIDPDLVEPETDNQKRLLNLLRQRGLLRGRQIAHEMPQRAWQTSVIQLVERGVVQREPILDMPDIDPKKIKLVEIAISPEQREETFRQLELEIQSLSGTRQSAGTRRLEMLKELARHHKPLEIGSLYAAVPGSKLNDVRYIVEHEYAVLREADLWRDSLHTYEFSPETAPRLTADQEAAWQRVSENMASDERMPILIHGVTGSGKTEIYLKAVSEALERGQSALVMVPEIALTPQTVRRFGARFPAVMGLVHSELSARERYDTWRRVLSGHIRVLVGPRSALFMPLQKLGLIVIDECHDDSYKQSPPVAPPYYHTIPAALRMASLSGASVILGSATPDVTIYAQAKAGRYQLVELPNRIMGHRQAIKAQAAHFHIQGTRYSHSAQDPNEAVAIEMPPVEIVDMRQELQANNRSIFSRSLQRQLQQVLKQNEQAILFLNRRGSATYVFCRACGHVLRCPRCDIPFAWHVISARGKEDGILLCHQCNSRARQPSTCPNCKSNQIRYFGGGTERVEQEVQVQFPSARVIRWDRDTTTKRGSHGAIMEQFAEHHADILIGTQMVAKGLDLPMVTLVGVINADTALNIPDYRSEERTFQLLTQVAGRAGRGIMGGRVIIQTYNSQHSAIQMAAQHDFERFYSYEIENRKQLGYPPFTRLGRIIVRAESLEKVRKEATQVYETIKKQLELKGQPTHNIIGPAPCFYPRRDKLYRWHVIVRSPDPADLFKEWSSSPMRQIDIDPVSLL